MMSRFFYSLIVIALYSTCLNAQKPSVILNAPDSTSLAVQNNGNFDFGTITEGKIIMAYFYLKNMGESPLVVDGIETDCGCVVTSKISQPIIPNDSVELSVQFNSINKLGPRNQKISISVDSTIIGTLTIRGNVNPKSYRAELNKQDPPPLYFRWSNLRANCINVPLTEKGEIFTLATPEVEIGESYTLIILSEDGGIVEFRSIVNAAKYQDFIFAEYKPGHYYVLLMKTGFDPRVRCIEVE